MPDLTRLKLNDVGHFKDIDLKLDAASITRVEGRNRNSSGAETSNGVGKTTLFSAIPAICYDEPILNTGGRSASRGFFGEGSGTLYIKDTDTTWKIKAHSKGKGVGLKIFQNGEDLHYRKRVDVEKKRAQIFPLNEDQFYSTVLLTSVKQNVLLRGKGVARVALLENLLGFHLYEQYRKKLLPVLEKTRGTSTALREMERSFKEMPSPKDQDTLDKKAKTAKEERRRLREEKDRLETKVKAIRQWIAVSDTLDEDIVELNKKINVISSRMQLHEEWKAYRKWRKKAANIDELQSFVDDNKHTKSADLVAANKIVNRLEDELTAADKRRDALDKYRALKKQTKDYDGPSADTLKARIQSIRDTLEHLSRTNSDNCPTCGTEIKNGTAGLKKIYNNRLEKAKESLILAEAVETLDQLKKQGVTLKSAEEYDTIKANFDKAKKKAREIEDTLERLAEARDTLHSLGERVKKPKEDDPGEGLEEELISLKKKLRNAESQAEQREDLAKDGTSYKTVEAAEAEEAKYRKALSRTEKELDEAEEAYDRANAAALSNKERREDWNNRKREINILRIKAEEEKVYKDAWDLLGPNGLRASELENRAKHFVDRLNEYAPLVFPETVGFDLGIEDRQLKINVMMGSKPYDACTLSNAEGQAFGLLSIFALLPLIPEKKRTNIIVLDDLEGGLHPTNRGMYARFIPEIAKVVPHVFVISALPESEFKFNYDRKLVICKEGDIASIEEE